VKWLQDTDEVGSAQAIDVKFSHDLAHQKITKIG